MERSLAGIRVIEVGHYIAGPYCGQLLADLGAEVIKVERPGGEASREFGPYVNGESIYYTSYNRNKKGVTIDFKSAPGKDCFRRLVNSADVVIDNQKPGFLKKMGFSYEQMRTENPGLVYTQISGYGQTGPLWDRTALDMVMQGVGGMMIMTGFPDDPPTKAGVAVVDFTTALYATIGTVVALLAREKTGRGQVVDVAMLDSIFTLLENWPALNKMTGFVPPRVGNSRVATGPSNAYRTSDGYVYIAAVANAHFAILAKEIGHPELIDDPTLATSAMRKQEQARLDPLIAEWAANFTSKEILDRLGKIGITVGPINSISDLIKDEQLNAREMLIEMKHPNVDELTMIGNPIKLSDTPVQYILPPPLVGQHNREVMQSVGYSDAEIDAMLESQ